MKEDLEFPEVKDVFLAAVHEEHEEYGTKDWNAYLINAGKTPLETVLIATKGYDGKKQTATMRHSISNLPPQSFAKIEFLQEDLLKLNNEFSISFFSEGKMYHKKYIFKKNSINEKALQELPVMLKKGVLLK